MILLLQRLFGWTGDEPGEGREPYWKSEYWGRGRRPRVGGHYRVNNRFRKKQLKDD